VATRARATVGEISSALEGVYGRYQATIRSISGVYAGEWEGDQGLQRIRSDIAQFAEEEGRRPRLMVVKMGQDGHDRGAKVIATAFADLGFDVDIGPLFQTPQEAARAAIENDAHTSLSSAIGRSSTSPSAITTATMSARSAHVRDGACPLAPSVNEAEIRSCLSGRRRYI
jgi:methylmalonyl-CoA mutase